MTPGEGRESESVVDTPRVSSARVILWPGGFSCPKQTHTLRPSKIFCPMVRLSRVVPPESETSSPCFPLLRGQPLRSAGPNRRRRGNVSPPDKPFFEGCTSFYPARLCAPATTQVGFCTAPARHSWTRGMNAYWSHGAERLGPPAERAAQRFRRGSPMSGAPYTHGAERFGPRAERAPQRLPDVEEPIHSWGAEVYAL